MQVGQFFTVQGTVLLPTCNLLYLCNEEIIWTLLFSETLYVIKKLVIKLSKWGISVSHAINVSYQQVSGYSRFSAFVDKN